jgi:hypothetical protein
VSSFDGSKWTTYNTLFPILWYGLLLTFDDEAGKVWRVGETRYSLGTTSCPIGGFWSCLPLECCFTSMAWLSKRW